MGGGARIDVVQPHRHSARLGTFTNAEHADATAAIDAAMAAKDGVGGHPVRRAGRGVPARRRPAGRAVAGEALRRNHARPVQDRLSGRDRRGLRADRLLAVQRRASPGRSWRSSRSARRGVWNRTDYRPLEGFVYAITPFNFTAIAGNLPTAPALMGNTVVWKPSPTQTFAAYLTMQLLEAAGLPPGVINLLAGDGHRGFRCGAGRSAAGRHPLHRLDRRRSSTCGARSARTSTATTPTRGWSARPAARTSWSRTRRRGPDVLRTALIRGAFDYQGQKCSAASRAFVPRSVWQKMGDDFLGATEALRYGDVTDLTNYGGALIDDRSFAKNVKAIERAKSAAGVTVAAGGEYDDSEGYFVRPTVLLSDDPTRRVVLAPSTSGRSCRCTSTPTTDYEQMSRRRRQRREVRADRRGDRRRPGRGAAGRAPAALRGGQLLRQRQAHRRRRRPAAVRRVAGVGHQRQGRFGAEPAALDVGPVDQGDVRSAHRPHLPAHGGASDGH